MSFVIALAALALQDMSVETVDGPPPPLLVRVEPPEAVDEPTIKSAPLARQTMSPMLTWDLIDHAHRYDETPSADYEEACAGEPAPAMWEAVRGDARLVFIGTIHALPMGCRWANEAVADIATTADRLAVESDLNVSLTRFMGRMGLFAFSADNIPVKERIAPAAHDAYDALVAKSAYPASFFDKLDTWAVHLMLIDMESPLVVHPGVDAMLHQLFRRIPESEEEVATLESWRASLGHFDALSDAAQTALLEARLIAPRPSLLAVFSIEHFVPLVAAWRSGDIDHLEAMIDDEAHPELLERLLVDRNRDWIAPIMALLDKGGTSLVAVGTAHFVGPDNLVDLLAEEGLVLTRIQ